jgi:hypothetical protein
MLLNCSKFKRKMKRSSSFNETSTELIETNFHKENLKFFVNELDFLIDKLFRQVLIWS